MFRWFVGLVLGLAPALVYYLYAQAQEVMHDETYFSRLTMALEFGCVAGAIIGTVWAARLAITVYQEGGATRRIGGP
jgi:hypothetical protein